MIDIIICAVMALILFGTFNGVVIKWHNAEADKKQFWSTWWHRIGLVMRAFILLIVWLISAHSLLIFGIVFVLTTIEYNISINLINDLKWYYVGTTAKTDILIRKIFSFIDFDKNR
jgi:hypothetical protein